MMPSQSPERSHLLRQLSLLDSIMINAGVMIGSAIFLVPATIAQQVETPWLMLAVWLVAGLLSLCGALAFAELSAMMPASGGAVVYLSEAYHPFWGYLYGWTVFAVIQTASIAAVAVALATYVGYFIALTPWMIKLISILIILFLSWLNGLGVKQGAHMQNVSTLLKVGLLLIIIVACLIGPREGVADFSTWWPATPQTTLLSQFGVAIMAALWAYDGWISITYVGGEVRQPDRFLPRSITFSVLVVIVLYALVNLAYSISLPMASMAQSERVAATAVQQAVGPWGGALVALAVIVSCWAAVNGMILSGGRVYYAMAVEGLFFKRLASLHPTRHTPVASLYVQGLWASLIALTGTYDQLVTYVIFDSWFFYAMGGAAVLILRRKQPDRARAYRTWGYPYVPILFVGLSLVLLINTLVSDPRDASIGIGIALLGVPGYIAWSKKPVMSEPPLQRQ